MSSGRALSRQSAYSWKSWASGLVPSSVGGVGVVSCEPPRPGRVPPPPSEVVRSESGRGLAGASIS